MGSVEGITISVLVDKLGTIGIFLSIELPELNRVLGMWQEFFEQLDPGVVKAPGRDD